MSKKYSNYLKNNYNNHLFFVFLRPYTLFVFTFLYKRYDIIFQRLQFYYYI